MGIQLSELENITPYQFNLLREGYALDQESQWRRARHQAYWTYVMAGKTVENPISIEEFLPLTAEDLKAPKTKAFQIPEYTPEQEEEIFKLFNPDK
ncbi:hypothetical protein ASG33_08050 [Dyadobacter sp. Leaf189]|nr:hypothetical protein ASG33_08050 [Dyadobacter sp. Leaf189]